MKFFKIYLILTLVIVLLIPSCAYTEKRDLSTPLSRLIGHWQDSSEFKYYFSSIDSSTMTGSLIRVLPDKKIMMKYFEKWQDRCEIAFIEEVAGKATYCQYKILSQIPEGKKVEIAIFWPPGDNAFPLYSKITFYVEKNGRQMVLKDKRGKLIDSLKCINSKTSPEDK